MRCDQGGAAARSGEWARVRRTGARAGRARAGGARGARRRARPRVVRALVPARLLPGAGRPVQAAAREVVERVRADVGGQRGAQPRQRGRVLGAACARTRVTQRGRGRAPAGDVRPSSHILHRRLVSATKAASILW